MTDVLSDEAIFRMSFMISEASLGFVLNAIVVIALYKSYKTLTPSNFLYYQLLIADLVFLLIMIIFEGITLTTKSPANYILCQLDGFLIQAFEGMGLVLVSLQLLNPFRIIVLETNALSVRQLIWLVGAAWIFVAFPVASLPWISGDEYKLLPSKTWCYTNYIDPRWGTLVGLGMAIGLLILTPIMLGVGYIWIYLKMRYWRGKESKDKELQWFIIRRGFLLTCSAFAVWIFPVCMLAINKVNGRMDHDFFIGISGTASNVLNPVLLFLSHKKIRKTIYEWFYWVCGREMKSSDSTLSSSAKATSSRNRPSIAARLLPSDPNSPQVFS